MTLLLVLLAGILLPYIVSPFIYRSREARGRLAGTMVGIWVIACATAGICWVVYAAVTDGRAGIGWRGTFAVFYFSDSPVLASVALLVNIAMLCCIGAMGWLCYKESRAIVVAP